jgi:pimeloyl-ACP methyl ester carboxylesterase
MAFVSANGVRLHVQRLPQPAPAAPNPPLVFVHGLVDTLASYYFTLAGPVADLGFDVITYDLRGHGRSERTARGYSVGDAVDDLTGLLDALDVTGPAHVVGYSFGGTVTFAFAERCPERVASVVVIESEPPTPAWAQRTAAGMREVDTTMLDEAFMATQPDIVRKMADTVRQFEASTTVAAELFDPRWLLDTDRVRAITTPVRLVVGGDSDLAGRLEEFVPLLPDCTVTVVPGHGHMLFTSASQQVAAIVLPWLTERRMAHER